MFIKRTNQRTQLKSVPLDGFDMFLLNLLQDRLSMTQLVESAPRDALETMRHVLHLTELGLLQLDFESSDEQLLFSQMVDARSDPSEYAKTGRPPPPGVSTPIGSLGQLSTGIRMRPTPTATLPYEAERVTQRTKRK